MVRDTKTEQGRGQGCWKGCWMRCCMQFGRAAGQVSKDDTEWKTGRWRQVSPWGTWARGAWEARPAGASARGGTCSMEAWEGSSMRMGGVTRGCPDHFPMLFHLSPAASSSSAQCPLVTRADPSVHHLSLPSHHKPHGSRTLFHPRLYPQPWKVPAIGGPAERAG